MNEVEKHYAIFSLENEISKLKVSLPLTEIVKNDQYKVQVSKFLIFYQNYDMVNVSDHHPKLIFGPAIDGDLKDNEVPPF